MADSTTPLPFAVPIRLPNLSLAELKQLCVKHGLKSKAKKPNHTLHILGSGKPAKAYDPFTKATKADLITRLLKSQEQVKVYDGFTTDQLVKEIRRRKIDFAIAHNNADLIALLESADRARTFHRFLDLPPELRNPIYRFATVSDPSTALVRLCVPAVCQGSKQLRGECLPIYYGLNSFAINISANEYVPKPQRRMKLVHSSRTWPRDANWLTRAERAGTMKYLRRLVFVIQKSGRERETFTCTKVEFTGGVKAFEVKGLGVWEREPGLVGLKVVEGEENMLVALPAKLNGLLQGIVEKGDGVGPAAMRKIVHCFLQGSRYCIRW